MPLKLDDEITDAVEFGLGAATLNELMDEIGRRNLTAVLIWEKENRADPRTTRMSFEWRGRSPTHGIGLMNVMAHLVVQHFHVMAERKSNPPGADDAD
jgi:hypothetical protein